MIYTCTFNPAIDYKMVLDGFTEGELNRTTSNTFVAGGKGINVSIVLTNLAIENITTGFLGGFTGDIINDFVKKQYKLQTRFIDIKELTRVNVKLNNRGLETEVNALGPFVSKEEMDRMLRLIDTLETGDLLAIGGSPAQGYADNYIDVLRHCHNHKVEFIVDTSKKYLLDSLQFKPLLVKPNINELEDLFNETIVSDNEIIQYAKELLRLGAKNVIVSRGKDGALFINNDVVYTAQTIKGTVKNTVGAGDSMVAGFIKGYVNNKSNIEAFRLAVACGTATAFSDGLAHETDVNKYLKAVHIKEIKNEN